MLVLARTSGQIAVEMLRGSLVEQTIVDLGSKQTPQWEVTCEAKTVVGLNFSQSSEVKLFVANDIGLCCA